MTVISNINIQMVQMIAVSQQHYDQLLGLVRMLHQNMQMIFPSSEELQSVHQHWQKINSTLENGYQEMIESSKQDQLKIDALESEKQQLQASLAESRSEHANMVQSNTMQRSQLAKIEQENSRLRDSLKALRDDYRRQVRERDELIVELKEKAKKYKHKCQDQEEKLQSFDRKLSLLEAANLGSQIESEMDKQMGELQAELAELEGEGLEYSEGTDA